MPFSGFDQLDPRFSTLLQQYIAANPGLSVFSGYRTPARQAQLYAASDKSGHMVGSPTGSEHVHRLAADLMFDGQRLSALPVAQQQALQESAGKFGLKFPMSWEPWHVEPYWTRGATMAGGGALPTFINMDRPAATVGGEPDQPLLVSDIFGDRTEASGLMDMPAMPGAPPMTPERFAMGMIAGENPLRAMVFHKLFSLFA